ncbi:MAG: SUMF1/EgtB/PvdO family nonheme iron enzyme [Pseudomonadota bacterium]
MKKRLNRTVTCAVVLLCFAVGNAVADFSDYEQAIPGSGYSLDMVAIRGGSFQMGSERSAESPARSVTVGDFWIGRFEVNWQQYEIFVYRDESTFEQLASADKLASLAIDGVTGATSPYVEMSFGMGKDGFPAVNLTHYAALQYARWISAKTGRFYRLPTEAEWEYACRAGTQSAWSFGNDVATADAHAVYNDNSGDRYARTGSKAPNPWGLYDLHGNVAEWTMDQFDAGFYAKASKNNPWNRPTELYPRVARGGSWMHSADDMRCASRLPSAPKWKERDPQIPKSRWWHTNAPFVGFRLVSPRVQPEPEVIKQYWLDAIEDYGI